MKETETAEDVSQNKSDENITKIFKKLMKIKSTEALNDSLTSRCLVRFAVMTVLSG